MTIAQSLLPELDSESAMTRKVLARLPDAHFGFKPHPKSMSLGDLASHVTTMVYWGTATLQHPEFDVAPGGVQLVSPKYVNQSQLLAAFDANLAAFRAELAKTSDAAMQQSWALKNNGAVFFEMPRIAVIRGMILNHLIHHRAQLCVYLRLLNLPVPAVYGPTADEQ